MLVKYDFIYQSSLFGTEEIIQDERVTLAGLDAWSNEGYEVGTIFTEIVSVFAMLYSDPIYTRKPMHVERSGILFVPLSCSSVCIASVAFLG